jgi:hypothetical protein
MKRLSLLGIVCLLTVAFNLGCDADEKPPADAKPVSEIARTIEQRPDFQAFESIEFEHGVYEVEYYTKEGKEKKLHLDPVSGAEK